ncbi:MAG: VWA domain-containing protein, partial [Planctomycetota bacterium]|nr:VWA domain-containing protein [Planctomycetota bacterium]
GIHLSKHQDNLLTIVLPPQTESIQIYEVKIFSNEFLEPVGVPPDGRDKLRDLRPKGVLSGAGSYPEPLSLNGIPSEGQDKQSEGNEITLENNYWKSVIQKIGRVKVLYLTDAVMKEERTAFRAIRESNLFEVGGEIKEDTFKLHNIIVLDNIPSSAIPHLSALQSFVPNGGSLFVIGGENSFALGNYHNSPLESILPVSSVPPEDLAVIIVLDASGSMAEGTGAIPPTKFFLASDAIQDSLSLLANSDRVGIIIFNQGYEVLVPLKPTQSAVPELKERLTKVKPTGPTAIIPPLSQAINILNKVSAAKKHIILLSDGYSTTGETLDGFREIAARLREHSLTISVIATGENVHQETLKTLTGDEGTTGRLYHLKDGKGDGGMETLSKNIQDALAIQKDFYREGDNLEVIGHIKEGCLKGIDNIPSISGYNRTTLKPQARLIASVSSVPEAPRIPSRKHSGFGTWRPALVATIPRGTGGPDKEPLIADWHYGSGKVLVLTTSLSASPSRDGGYQGGSDAQTVARPSPGSRQRDRGALGGDSEWMGQWQNWDALGQLIIQGLRSLIPSHRVSSETPVKIETEEEIQDRIKLIVRTTINNLDLSAQIEPLSSAARQPFSPFLSTMITRIPQTAIGKYEVRLDLNTLIEKVDNNGLLISVFSNRNDEPDILSPPDSGISPWAIFPPPPPPGELLGKIPLITQYQKEWRNLGVSPGSLSFLSRIAQMTSGRLLSPGEIEQVIPIGAMGAEKPSGYNPVNTTLIILVMILFIVDLLILSRYK